MLQGSFGLAQPLGNSSKMSPGVLSGRFALAGVLLTGVLSLVAYLMKTRGDLRRYLLTKHFDRRSRAYERTIDFVTRSYESGPGRPTADEARDLYRELLLVASPEIVDAFNRISDTSADTLRRTGLEEAAVRETQMQVYREAVNAVRGDLYPDHRPLSAEAIRIIEPKAPTLRSPLAEATVRTSHPSP